MNEFRSRESESIAYKEFTFAKCLVFVFSALAMRSWSDVPSKLAPRISFISLLFFGTMIYYYWEANLISYLTTRVTPLPFQSLSQLLTLTNFRIILVPGTSYMDAFKTSKNETWMRAWSERIEPRLHELQGLYTKDLIELLDTDSEAALYDNYYSVITHDQFQVCKIVAIPSKYDFKPYAFGFQKNSPFLGIFNFYLKEMKEKGSLDQILNKYEAKPQECPVYTREALSIGNVITAFGILFLGAGFALFLVGIEFMSSLIGLDIPILSSYGIHQSSHETTKIEILMRQNLALQQELQILKQCLEAKF